MAIVGLRLKSFMQRPLPTTDSDSKFHGVHVLFYFLPNPIADIEPMTFQLQCWHANHCTNTDISYIYAVQLVTYNVLQIIIVLFSQRTSTGVFNGISLCESPPKGFGWSGDSHRMRENGRYSDQVQRVGTAVFERERERERERHGLCVKESLSGCLWERVVKLYENISVNCQEWEWKEMRLLRQHFCVS